MRAAIVSRIFEPEPSAASFRLAALAQVMASSGHELTVLTVHPARPLRAPEQDSVRPYLVRRFPVLRDRTGYVRGYLQYLSFDVPLFFRILFGVKRDLIVVEPPPTTGFFARAAARLRRTPYAYFAADIWSDASDHAGVPAWMVRLVRRLERFSMRGADVVLSVNEGVTARLAQLGITRNVVTVGNGVDTSIFSASNADRGRRDHPPYAIYSGTASEWQGAGIFIDALARVRRTVPEARLVFIGQGSDWSELQAKAAALPNGAVEFVPTVPPAAAAEWIRGAVASLASIRPDSGYDFAFPTKVYASIACGTPVVYSGVGAVPAFLRDHQGEAELGESTEYDVDAVAGALLRAFTSPLSSESRKQLSAWAAERVSIDAVARTAMQALEQCLR